MPVDSTTEKTRVLIVNLVFLVYWLTVFEGALRKWVVPEFGTLIYFLKDPFVFIVYFLAFKHHLFPRNSLITFACSIAVLFFFLALFQVFVLNSNLLVVCYGLRNYLWYIPLAFIIGETFRGKDLARLLRETLIVVIPIAGLVYYQFRSPSSHWINRYVSSEVEPHMVGDVVRTCGTFSFLTGQTTFVALLIPMIFLVWCLPKQYRPIGSMTGIFSTLAVLLNIILNGSRAILLNGVITAGTALLYVALMVSQHSALRVMQRMIVLWLVSVTMLGAVVVLFPAALEAQYSRLQGEKGVANSDLAGRANPVKLIEMTAGSVCATPALGYGIGLGSSGGAAIASGQRNMYLNENEWPRIVEECGLIGLCYLAFRFYFVVWLTVGAYFAVTRSTNPLPILLLSFSGVSLVIAPLAMGGTPTYFGWLFAGFCLAANKLGMPTNQHQPPKEIAKCAS